MNFGVVVLGGVRLGSSVCFPEIGDPTTVADLPRYVRFDPAALRTAYQEKIAAAELDPDRKAAWLAELEAGLQGYTYLEP